jgi:hypothetical protein
VRLFDWRNRLNQGKRMIPLWPYSKELLAVVSGDQLGPLQYLNFSVLYNTSTCHFFDSPSSSSNCNC